MSANKEIDATADVPLKGVAPPMQARSQATFEALVQAGRQVMEEKDFETVTISEIVCTAGASTGAFYGRFTNKDMFFSAIQEITVSDIEASMRVCLADPATRAARDSAFMLIIARFWVNFYRTHRGLYVASFKHARTQPSAWTPFKRLGHNIASQVIEDLTPRLEKLGKPRSEREIRIAFQFVNGLLVNAVLNAPGPLSIKDTEIEDRIGSFLCSYFGIPAP